MPWAYYQVHGFITGKGFCQQIFVDILLGTEITE